MDLHNDFPAEVKFQRDVIFTPTFVLVDQGRELARIEGYPGEDFFWGPLNQLMVDQIGLEEGS